jgi:peptide/nickel transport system substrate-binding protein
VKRDVPALKMYRQVPNTVSAGDALRFGVLPTPANKPFLDERVRQAISMSYDRDLYIDTFNNVKKFESEGLPVDTYWFTSIGNAKGWWLDPKSKDFGPNAKYFQYDPTEAKKLLTAAGFPNGLDVTSTYIAGPERGPDYQKIIAVRDEFAHQVGFKITPNLVDYNTVYIPKLRDGRGDFEGWTYSGGAPNADDAVAYLVWRYYSKGPATFLGFDVNGKGDHSGDPYIDAQVEKAKGEVDTEKRRALVFDVQRYLAKVMWGISDPGSASTFQLAWPVLGNFGVFDADRRGPNYNWWIDDTQPPLKKA